MEINEIQRKKEKSLQYYQIYARKDFKNKLKMHNIVDYYDKPSNKDKYSYKISFQKPSPLGPSKNKNKSFRVQLMKILKEDSDNPDSSSENIKINSMSIEEIPDSVSPSRNGKGMPKLDFPLGLQSIISVIYSQRKVYPLLACKSQKQYWNLVIVQYTIRLPPLKFQLHFGYMKRKYRPRLQLIQELPQTITYSQKEL